MPAQVEADVFHDDTCALGAFGPLAPFAAAASVPSASGAPLTDKDWCVSAEEGLQRQEAAAYDLEVRLDNTEKDKSARGSPLGRDNRKLTSRRPAPPRPRLHQDCST